MNITSAIEKVYNDISGHQRKNVAIMCMGNSGAGKTTFARQIQFLFPSSLVCPDDIRKELTGDELNQTVNDWVWRMAYGQIEGAFRTSQPVIVDATFAKKRDRLEMIQYLGGKYSHLVGIWFNISLEECLNHNAVRECPRPEGSIRKMHSFIWGDSKPGFRFALPSKDEGFSTFFRVYNTGLGYYNAHEVL